MEERRALTNIFYVALTGNPNCGKTTVFNALTGLNAKVGNYPGVTVERKEGKLKGTPPDKQIIILDLPGTYSFSPKSLDEQVAKDVLFNRISDIPRLSSVVVILDAANLQRNLYYATQVIELGYPVIIGLNMMDVAAENDEIVNIEKLSRRLNVPVIPMVASKKEGITALRQAIIEQVSKLDKFIPNTTLFLRLPDYYKAEVEDISKLLRERGNAQVNSYAEAILIISDEKALGERGKHYPEVVYEAVQEARKRIESAGGDWKTDVIEARYEFISDINSDCVTQILNVHETFSDKLDRILTHRIFGLIIFFSVMLLMFQSIFRLAKLPMDLIASAVGSLGGYVVENMPPGALTNLITDGVIAGVGAVVVFLPQIILLFLFLSFLEDTGYMSRAAFIMDRLMSKVGLHGKSFVPLLSSFACAVPGIMATRTIESHKDRLVTILIAPLMSCSARLPVYAVLISACIPDLKVFGYLRLQGLTLMGAYLFGIILALVMALIFKKTILKGEIPMLLMELPPYKRPTLWTIFRHLWDRAVIFLRQAGTIILGVNIILWFLMSYPKSNVETRFNERRVENINSTLNISLTADKLDDFIKQLNEKSKLTNGLETVETKLLSELKLIDKEEVSERLGNSFAGRLGRTIEPIIKPLGFDWKIGIGILTSFASRETFVSTMAVIYSVESDEQEQSILTLANVFKEQKRSDGTKLFTPLTGLSLIVFYICALQCAATVVVVYRETNSFKWMIFQWLYFGILAWTLSFLVWNIGRSLGYY